MHRRTFCRQLALAPLAASVVGGPAGAQSYPAQQIKIVVPLAPGGVADIVARALAARLADQGKSIVVENRTGAGGVIGAEAVAKAPPDGYTLLLAYHATQSILPHLMARLPYDPVKDFAPIVYLATSPNVLIVHPSLPVTTPQELIAYAKANPGKLNVGTPGVGSSDHLASEQFRQIHGLDIAHVHYRGAAPAMQDLIAGQVQVMFAILPLARAQLGAGKVRALAILSARREPALPDVPTMAETGLPGVEGGPWFGLMAPAGTPRAAIDWINAEAVRAFTAPDLKARLEEQGLSLPLGTPEDFGRHIAAETVRWGEVIRRGNVKLEQ